MTVLQFRHIIGCKKSSESAFQKLMPEMEWTHLVKLKEYLITTLGTLLVAAGTYFFRFPNNFSIGGVSGISVILGSVFPDISAGTFLLIINLILLLLGFAFLGFSFGLKTIYVSVLLSVAVFALEKLVNQARRRGQIPRCMA